MKHDLPIGTIYHSSKHGHSTWILEEDTFKNVAVIYPGERMPWMICRTACNVCGMLKTDKKRTHRLCTSLECRKEHRADRKNVYWRLLRLGKQSKFHKELSKEEGLSIQCWEGSPEVVLKRAAIGKKYNPLECMNFKYPVYDGNNNTLREASKEERTYIIKFFK